MKNFTHSQFPHFCAILFFFLSFTVCAQTTLINNKGNRNQSYPVVTETNPEIVELINQVSEDSIENYIRYMQGFIRNARFPAALTVQNWLVDHFESYGYEDISIHYFTHQSQQLNAGNVVVVKKGALFPDEYIMISSHYDQPDGPGADDNASGTAGVMECARLLKDFPTKRSIIFVPFNAEEMWMVGSMPFAQKCATENMNIIAHFNMDMIGWFPPSIPDLEMASGYSYISEALFKYYQQTANTYIPSIPTIRLSDGDSYGGDHMPFNVYEYPSLYIGDIEHDSPCYHKSCDTIGIGVYYAGVNNLNLAKAFVQAVLAAASELANAWLPPQNLSACSGTDKITVSWDSSEEPNSYKVYRNNTLLDETTENFYVDYNVELGEKYEYYVIDLSNAPSNKDEITFVEPLQLPYSNDFKTNKYGFEQSNWVRVNMGSTGTLCNTAGSSHLSDNYLSIAELDWFPIPDNANNISIRFRWRGNIIGIWYMMSSWSHKEDWNNAGMYFEVTNDRKTWHKLAHISGNMLNWRNYEFSLNDYIGSDFFQARFRLESSGTQYVPYSKIGYITDVEVGFGLGIDEPKENLPYISSFNFMPNPASSYVNIATNQHEPYHIAIYDMAGRIIFAQDGFNDGTLSVAHLRAGNYLIVASTKRHRMAKKLVIQ
ncbi:MAG: M28 family peptidase [Bacteroidetes bacterium]|nr:M28 family peptidase [Bacteroidota bacterium]MCL2303504.1 M28 family peptidase [Lentimicrobiaceae bacterium]